MTKVKGLGFTAFPDRGLESLGFKGLGFVHSGFGASCLKGLGCAFRVWGGSSLFESQG